MLHFFEREDERLEVGVGIGVEQFIELLTVLCDKLAKRRQDLLGRKLVESRQRPGIEERVGHGAGY